ncbi:MAG TPA: HD-GYP domain-containing protein [Gemmatimonadales bacterium]|nr:HD-GYP domain-containing protein [Gemmatimonadales bacterium]
MSDDATPPRRTTPSPQRASVAVSSAGTGSGEAALRHGGRGLLLLFYSAHRALKLYPVENATVQRSLDDLQAATVALLETEHEIEVRVAGDFIFVNSTRLRLELDNYASFSSILGIFREFDVGAVRIDEGVERREWQAFLSLFLSLAGRPAAAGGGKFEELTGRMVGAQVEHIHLETASEAAEAAGDAESQRYAAKRTYSQGVAVTREVMTGARLGRAPSVKKMKRAVQAVVDQVLNNETSLVGLTTIRDYDEYTFTHSVNVCIFSVAIGKRLGLSKQQLYDLGLAALLHDVGKARVPLEILNKTGGLTEDEWRVMQSHPWLGVLTLFGLRGYGEIPYRAAIVAAEHHMKTDLSGYPRVIRSREQGTYSRLVAVADGFDAATSRRSYQTVPIQPDQVLKEMWDNPRRGYDRVMVKALINLLGVYPVGTVVVLDTLEVGVVAGANPDPTLLNRPLVRLALDADGGIYPPPGQQVDLGEIDEAGHFRRSIVKVTSPDRYGLTVGDYFV